MSRSFQVVLSDLEAASHAFDQESETFAAIMPADGPSSADTGEAASNEALGATLQMMGELHQAIAASIRTHGARLKAASDRYSCTEADVAGMCGPLTHIGEERY